MTKSALLLGASGLVGSSLLRLLLEGADYEKVTVFVRRELKLEHPKLVQRVVDFERLGEFSAEFRVDDVFCCLGTTIRKAGSQEAFRKVDFTYPVECAKLAKAEGAERFLIITAMGANARSGIFYNRVKGEVEEALMGLHLPSLHIFRPSLLLGERAEMRVGESIGIKLAPVLGAVLVGPLRKYRAIEGRVVAKAMYRVAQGVDARVHVYLSDRIAEVGRA
ncbi:MAG: oxidoreductase [Tumebacillaceae bacterium]